jgi:zinc D-Ala-D-Ala carboxypeptidase
MLYKIPEFFTEREFRCPCCGECDMKHDFIEQLYAMRLIAQFSFVVSSGFRCSNHNAAVGSKSENHVHGRAADVLCASDRLRKAIIEAAIRAGFGRIGIHQNFIHVDNMNVEGSKEAIWVY